jgi:hypothetical protein
MATQANFVTFIYPGPNMTEWVLCSLFWFCLMPWTYCWPFIPLYQYKMYTAYSISKRFDLNHYYTFLFKGFRNWITVYAPAIFVCNTRLEPTYMNIIRFLGNYLHVFRRDESCKCDSKNNRCFVMSGIFYTFFFLFIF